MVCLTHQKVADLRYGQAGIDLDVGQGVFGQIFEFGFSRVLDHD